MKLKLFILIMLSVFYLNAFAGKKMTITGVALDAAGTPVTHAMVLVDGKSTTTYTDDDGKYRIKVNEDATTLAILTQSNGVMGELINGRTKINFKFISVVNKQSPLTGEEQVNTGYSKIKEKNLSSGINYIDANNLKCMYTILQFAT